MSEGGNWAIICMRQDLIITRQVVDRITMAHPDLLLTPQAFQDANSLINSCISDAELSFFGWFDQSSSKVGD